MIKRLRSDVSKLSEIAKGNATKNQEWLRKLIDTPVTTALEIAKQCLVALAARLIKYNSEYEARTINFLANQLRPIASFLYRVSSCLPMDVLLLIYNSFVNSKLSYCV